MSPASVISVILLPDIVLQGQELSRSRPARAKAVAAAQ